MTRLRDILEGCFMVVAAPFLFMAYVVRPFGFGI